MHSVGPAGAGSGVWDRAHRRLTIGLLLTISITAFEALAVATVLPSTATDLGGADLGWYGWVFSGFMLANLVGIPAAGRLADRGGTARPFLVGSFFFAAGLLVAGLAPSMPVVVAGRIAQGFGAGALSSVVYVAIARDYPAGDQPRMLALLASAWVVPGLIGPGIAAALASLLGWRSVFLALVPMTGIAAGLAVGGLDDAAPVAKERGEAMPMGPAVVLAAGAALAQLGAESQRVDLALACVGAGVALAFPALRRLFPAGTLVAAPGAPAALAAKGLVTFAFFGTEAFLPLALTVVRGESIAMAGIALTAGTLSWTTGAWIQERVVTPARRVVLVRAGLAMVAVAVCGAAFVLVTDAPVVVAIASWIVAGLGIGVSYSTTTLIVFERTPKGGEGMAASALQLANVLGVAFGTGTGGAMLALAVAGGRSESVAIGLIDAVMLGAALLGLLAASRCELSESGRRRGTRTGLSQAGQGLATGL